MNDDREEQTLAYLEMQIARRAAATPERWEPLNRELAKLLQGTTEGISLAVLCNALAVQIHGMAAAFVEQTGGEYEQCSDTTLKLAVRMVRSMAEAARRRQRGRRHDGR